MPDSAHRPDDWRSFAIPLRFGCVVTLVMWAVWEFVVPLPPGAAPDSLRLRVGVALVAGGVYLLTLIVRHPTGLRLLGLIMALDAAAYSLWLFPQATTTLLEALIIVTLVVVGGAMLLPWSWRWQSVMAVVVCGGAAVALRVLADPPLDPWFSRRLGIHLTAIAAISILGAVTVQHERERRIRSERREEAARRYESVARMAGRFAHEFNNILGTVLASATLLRERQAPGTPTASEDDIIAAAERGRVLTDTLQRYTSHVAVALVPVAPAQLAAESTRLIRESLPDTVTLRTDVAPDLPLIAADASHAVHALLELGLNARDAFGVHGGVITLSVAREVVTRPDARWPDTEAGAYVRFTVSDTGPGLSADARAQLFEPFVTAKDTGNNTGLGLASVRWIARAHAGGLGVASKPGAGTQVHLLIPVAPATPARTAGSLQGATVLVADDDAVLRRTMTRALTHLGARPLEAVDGDEAVRFLAAAEPPVDLVLLDVVMPAGGLPCYHKLKAERPDVRVLVCTGFGPEGEASAILAAGADGLLAKPFEIAELKRSAEAALARA